MRGGCRGRVRKDYIIMIGNKKRKKGNILARGEGNCMSFPKR